MSKFTPTEEQKAAIETEGTSLLISAGAGSGKTKVLTERLMRYVLGGENHSNYTDIDRFVIITFTQAAAGELKSRIMEELLQAAAEAETTPGVSPAYRKHLRRQQALIGRAQIGTIHHFCLSLLRENAHAPELGLSPDFKIMSDVRAASMKEDTLTAVLEERYTHRSDYPGFEELVNSVGIGRDDSALEELVLRLYERMQCHAFPSQWAEECIAELSRDFTDVGETRWGCEILNYAARISKYWSDEMDRLISIAAQDPELAKPLNNLSDTAAGIRDFSRRIALGWDSVASSPEVDFGRLVFPKKMSHPESAELIKNRRNTCKQVFNSLSSLFADDSRTLLSGIAITAPAMKALFALTLDFEKAFAKNKLRAGLADYSDLEHKTAALLLEPDAETGDLRKTLLAHAISSRYREIMVDEFQDVSEVQDAIFQAVSQDASNLFMVGDVKQAIYRFRLADPKIFNSKQELFRQSEAEHTNIGRSILLTDNFRSRREILDCANSVFSFCMSELIGDTEYNDAVSLKYGSRAYSGSVPVPELTLIPDSDSNRSAEAEYVAEAIEQLVRSGTEITDGSSRRPITYGDIAILLRSANSVGGIFRRALLDKGIPVASSQGGGFFETREIALIFSLLKLMDNPHRDAELVSVLSSPLYGFTADELALIRSSAGKEDDLWTALSLFPADSAVSAETQRKISSFLSELERFRSAAPDQTADRTVRMLLSGTRLPLLFSAMPDGAQRVENIERLIGIGASFEADGQHGLHRFIQYLTRMQARNSELPSASGAASSVKIISIHRSKGLQYPVVFLCDTARSFNQQDMREAVLVHSELGLGPQLVDPVRKLRSPTIARRAIALRAKQELLSEEMRLLYVAMTRPEEYLFITASMKDPQKVANDWSRSVSAVYSRPDPEMMSDAKSFSDWLLAAAFADGEQHLHLQYAAPEKTSDAEDDVVCSSEQLQLPQSDPCDSVFSTEEPDDLIAALNYVYPYTAAAQLPSKVTATDLKHLGAQDDPEAFHLAAAETSTHRSVWKKPVFLRDTAPLAAAEKGTATHLALQHLNFSVGSDACAIAGELDRLTASGLLSVRQREAISVDSLSALLSSPLGNRLAHAEKLHREFRFSLLCDAEKLLGTGGEEQLLLQGVADCFFEEGGELVIVDYKTDRITSEEELFLKTELYTSQLRAYAEALGRIFRKPVREAVLFFLSVGKESVVSLK